MKHASQTHARSRYRQVYSPGGQRNYILRKYTTIPNKIKGFTSISIVKSQKMTDGERLETGVGLTTGKRLTYRQVIRGNKQFKQSDCLVKPKAPRIPRGRKSHRAKKNKTETKKNQPEFMMPDLSGHKFEDVLKTMLQKSPPKQKRKK